MSEKNDLSFGRDRIISVANMYFNSAVYVTEDSYLATYNVMRLGDIAFEGNRNKRFAHGRFVENTIGDGIVSHVFKVFRPVGNNFDLAYWKHAINNEKLMKDALTRSTKASTMMHELVSSDFLEESTLVPSLDEQRAIGTAIDSIDNLITLHQRKCQYRGLYGYLSWEQRKLGRLFFESNERSSSMEILSVSVAKGIYPASESDRDTNPGASLANYKVVHKGDVVYNSMRMWQGAVGSSDYDGIVSPAYVVARPAIELDSTCFGYLLKRPEMLYKYLCDSQGNSKDTQTLKYNRFADIEVTMPANLEEQRVISACLGRVSTLITLHQ